MLYFARWKIILVVVVCVFGIAFTTPNFLSKSTLQDAPDWTPSQQVRLGLDLQGGAHWLFEVDTNSVVERRLENLVESVRGALRKEKIGYRGLSATNGAVRVTIRNAEEVDAALQKVRGLSEFLTGNLLSGQGGGRELDVTVESDNQIVATLTELAIEDRIRSAVEQVVEIYRIRIEEFGVREPTIQRQSSNRILIQLPGISDDEAERLKELLKQTAQMNFHLVNQNVSPSDPIPASSKLLPSYDDGANGNPRYQTVVYKRVMVSGENLVDAQPTYDQGQPVVSFRFDAQGGKKFGEVTRENVGRPFAIVLDGKVISAPTIRSAILGGSGIITGGFTPQSAADLALLLRAGSLPADTEIIEERSVGPGLGADSIEAGKIASIIAFVAVMIFMVITYGSFGLAADIALIVNMFLIVGALSALQATLTLPGIAGIVLTMGMAVDANVLVFERIKEEVRSGKTPFAAMEAGYKRAFGTILDANITTFIAAVIMFSIGSGPIKGFAVTLAIGILTSVFTAVTVTRLMLVLWVRRTRPKALPI